MRDWKWGDILFFAIMSFLAIAAILELLVIFSRIGDYDGQARFQFEQRNRIVEQCLSNEQYTRQECIILAGGQK